MVEEYAKLLETYRRMFGMVDAFHFNSQSTADVYGRYLDIPAESRVITITHSGIKDRREKRVFDNRLLRLSFIGSEAPYKGLQMLKKVITKYNLEGSADKISLSVYGGRTGIDEKIKNVVYKGRFISSMMEQVFNDMDLLVVPSICYETFSFVTLEALSYGIPVLVSNKVGAKDIVGKYNPEFVFRDEVDLYELIKKLVEDRKLLVNYNNAIINNDWNYSMKKHTNQIIKELYTK